MSESTINWWKIALIALLFIGVGIGGYFIGRKSVETKTETIIKYIPGDTITKIVTKLEPCEVILPVDTLGIIEKCIEDGIYKEIIPSIHDTIFVSQADTNKILIDWATAREYREKIFDIDTVGKCNIDAKVQYNRLTVLGYNYIPYTKEITTNTIVKRKFAPFIGAGLTIYPSIEAEIGGIFNESWGFAVDGRYNFKAGDGEIKWDIGLKIIKEF